MYVVTIHEPKGQFPYDNEGTVIHTDNGSRNLKAKFKLNLVYEGVSSLTIDLLPSNPFYDQLVPFQTLIKVRSLITGKDLFKGRVMDSNYSMSSSGQVVASYVCESRLSFLNDSTQVWKKVQDTTIKDFFTMLIDRHNSRVEDYKKFKIGEVTVQNSTDNVYRYVDYGLSLEQIKDKLTSRLGGVLRVRDEVDGMYLDYLETVDRKGKNPIMLQRNLKLFKKHVDPTEIISRVYVYGKRLEEDNQDDQDEDVGSVSSPRLTMAKENDGRYYLEDKDLIAEYGIQEGVLTFDNISEAKNLVSRAESFFKSQKAAKQTYDIEAINLHLIDSNFDEFEVGHWYDIVLYPLLKIEDTLQIIEISIDSENPQRNGLKIGDKSITLSEYQMNNRRLQQAVGQLESRIISDAERFNSRYRMLEDQYSKENESLRERIEELENRPIYIPPAEDGPSSGLPPVFPVDYTRSGINFWTNSNGMYYGAPRDGGARQHAGFDIGGGGSSHPIYAVQDGVVTWAGSKGGGLGIYVTIQHSGDEYHTLYGHLASTTVSSGQTVKRGQQIGMMGSTGGNYAIHLHIELSKTGSFHTMTNTVDPAPYLGVTSNNVTTLQNPTRI